jgi:UDP-N-acetylmuramoyl-L-alanyl-D-glutamate--2,6-diaminopimelate ligase
MKLKKLFKDISIKQVKGSKEVEVTGICANSKLVAPGNLFIAKRGFLDDGNRYIPEAIAAGASAILTDLYDPSLKVTQVICANVNETEGLVAAHYYQFASDDLYLVGITGTNGKTTTSFIVKHVLDKLRGSCGLIGTIEYIIGEHRYQATRTTPDVTSNHKMLREMVSQGCRSAVMEVTSHALDQGRVAHIDYDTAIFTNLTLDHLDYHQTMEAYCEAKAKLFATLGRSLRKKKGGYPKVAIVNVDSPWHRQMIRECREKVFTYAIENQADLRAANIRLTAGGTSFDLLYQGKTVPCTIALIGRFNVYNSLAGIALGLNNGVSLEEMAEILSTFRSVSGRLEPVPNALGLKIYVDYAHSDDALTNILECLNELKRGRIITVFGCGGDRDKTKRPKMAQAVEEYSDICLVTSDNPRSEDPAAICRDILKGFSSQRKVEVLLDRREAIRRAIELATPDDIVLIAGKGHETYQIFAHKVVEFDDRKVAAAVCESRSHSSLAAVQ